MEGRIDIFGLFTAEGKLKLLKSRTHTHTHTYTHTHTDCNYYGQRYMHYVTNLAV